ncbi:hypothetical protein [Natranaeroarchaeum sulfidigenes]|uniref:Uncharacterized protein n=1 Tax=Natranaeroarchaeum sulfidigenes TaxID=2784880 RepID=A0A897MQB2_9EURY|nr:hypothetical protein [Natranaeroarchaeum sulfidigenes]QSG02774.1 Uncharacterized protein AArcS_1563 [Natranaeroarchaeum sulfidigenes]
MTNGMKSGAGSDPFSDTSTDEESPEESEAQTKEREETSESASTSDAGANSTANKQSQATGSGQNRDTLPYIFARHSVKDSRKMIQYFLREATQETEKDARHAIEDELGTDVPLTDVREALVRVGANHPDEVADELRDWGYRLRED